MVPMRSRCIYCKVKVYLLHRAILIKLYQIVCSLYASGVNYVAATSYLRESFIILRQDFSDPKKRGKITI